MELERLKRQRIMVMTMITLKMMSKMV